MALITPYSPQGKEDPRSSLLREHSLPDPTQPHYTKRNPATGGIDTAGSRSEQQLWQSNAAIGMALRNRARRKE